MLIDATHIFKMVLSQLSSFEVFSFFKDNWMNPEMQDIMNIFKLA
jgi:hypothetical protein